MDTEKLRSLVARFYHVAASEVDDEFILSTPERQGSVARYALDSLVRRELGVQSRAVHTAKTYGELEAAFTGETRPAGRSPRPALALDGNVACGVDIEHIDTLPDASDYFAHPFYLDHFTKSEIAYALAQEAPRMHLTARWCAKEALKKCDPGFVETAMNAIEVAIDDTGRPRLRRIENGAAADLPYALSLTHTPDTAAAVVVAVSRPAQPAPSAPVMAPVKTAPPAQGRTSPAAIIVALAALALSIAALIL